MPLFIAVTRLTGEEIHPTLLLTERNHKIEHKLKEADLKIQWIANYVLMGPHDYLDVFEAPNLHAAHQLHTLLRSYGHAHVEIWPVMKWQDYKVLLQELPKFYSTEQQN